MADQFRVMQRIHLGVQRTNGEFDFYPSIILDFEEGRVVKAAVPMEQGREILVRATTPVLVDVPDSAAVMRYRSTVIGRSDAPVGLTLDWPTGSERVQRRNHFRVETRVPVEFKVVDNKGGPTKRGRGSTMDLSAGGVRLRLEEALPEGTVLQMDVQIRPGTWLQFMGRVVRSGEIDGLTVAERFWNGIAFQAITAIAYREINRYLMDVQREQLRRGVL